MNSKILNLSELEDAEFQDISHALKNGAIAIIPTDTIYGIVTSAKIPKSVEKIYKLRKRSSSKPMIILISSINQIKEFEITISARQRQILKNLWPAQISVVFECFSEKLHYLHRGTNSMAFRYPDNDFLKKLIQITGPLVAPSANFEGYKPSLNISEARRYFDDNIDFYIDNGELKSEPSTLLKFENNHLKILRQGASTIPGELLQ